MISSGMLSPLIRFRVRRSDRANWFVPPFSYNLPEYWGAPNYPFALAKDLSQ
jgi:hypothetical protein